MAGTSKGDKKAAKTRNKQNLKEAARKGGQASKGIRSKEK